MEYELGIAWAAGLFEGEGCFYQREDKALRASLVSTDRDIVDRFHVIVGCGSVFARAPQPGCKPSFDWTATHRGAERVFEMFSPYLGERRLARANEILAVRRTWLARFGEVDCETCGFPFQRKFSYQRFCSHPCKRAGYRKRRKLALSSTASEEE